MTYSRDIINKIGCPHLNLRRGSGYFYFEYDTIEAVAVDGQYETRSVCVMYLHDMSLERWVEEGKEFVEYMENKIK